MLSKYIFTLMNQKKSRLSNINVEVVLSLRSFVIKNVNYNWSIFEPDLRLNCVRNTDRQFNNDYVVVLPNYVETRNKLYKEQHKEIIDKNGEYA